MAGYNMSDWFEFHKCVLEGTCKVSNISEQTFMIDAGIFIVLFGIAIGIKRFLKGEKVLSRKKKAQVFVTRD